MKEKRCIFPGCNCKLSFYNPTQFCFLHNRILIQNNVEYKNSKYIIRRINVSGRLKKQKLKPWEVKKLKEIASINEYLEKQPTMWDKQEEKIIKQKDRR